MHPPAPTPRPRPELREIHVQEHTVQETNPLVPVEPRNFRPVDPATVLGWQQVSVGLVSSSAQRRRGRWVHRQDWAWLVAEEAARERMARHATTGFIAGLVVLWMPVHRTPDTSEDVATVGPARLPAMGELQWSAYRAMLNTALAPQPGLDYLFVEEYVRRGPAGDRDVWRHWVL